MTTTTTSKVIHFEHKGQMINYVNKLRKNDKIKFMTWGWEVGLGWTLRYHY